MDVRPARRMLRQGVAGEYTDDRSAPWAARLTLTDQGRSGMESMGDKLTHLPNCRFGDEANKLVGSAPARRSDGPSDNRRGSALDVLADAAHVRHRARRRGERARAAYARRGVLYGLAK